MARITFRPSTKKGPHAIELELPDDVQAGLALASLDSMEGETPNHISESHADFMRDARKGDVP